MRRWPRTACVARVVTGLCASVPSAAPETIRFASGMRLTVPEGATRLPPRALQPGIVSSRPYKTGVGTLLVAEAALEG